MNSIQHFRQLIVWQKAHQLFLDIIKDVEILPKTQTTRIVIDQMIRSCGSISANIAKVLVEERVKNIFTILSLQGGRHQKL